MQLCYLLNLTFCGGFTQFCEDFMRFITWFCVSLIVELLFIAYIQEIFSDFFICLQVFSKIQMLINFKTNTTPKSSPQLVSSGNNCFTQNTEWEETCKVLRFRFSSLFAKVTSYICSFPSWRERKSLPISCTILFSPPIVLETYCSRFPPLPAARWMDGFGGKLKILPKLQRRKKRNLR